MTDALGQVLLDLPEEKISITPKEIGSLQVELPTIPWYKLWYTVSYDVSHQAVSDVITEIITEDMLVAHTFTETATFFIFPWWIVAVLLALIILWKIAGMMAKKSRKRREELEELREYVHEHEQPQQQ